MIVYQEYSDDLIERKHACHKGVGTDESDFTQVPVPAGSTVCDCARDGPVKIFTRAPKKLHSG